MKNKRRFNDDVLLIDPLFVVRNDEDWEACKHGKSMKRIGINNYLLIPFNEDSMSINSETGAFLGAISSSSGYLIAAPLKEISNYNSSFKRSSFVIVPNFEGTISFKLNKIVRMSSIKDVVTVIKGKGKNAFSSEVK